MSDEKGCPACRHGHMMAAEYRRDPPTEGEESRGYDYAWCQGAAHVLAIAGESRGGPIVVALCTDHAKETAELLADLTGKPVTRLCPAPGPAN